MREEAKARGGRADRSVSANCPLEDRAGGRQGAREVMVLTAKIVHDARMRGTCTAFGGTMRDGRFS